jgi:predicted DNA-binding protein
MTSRRRVVMRQFTLRLPHELHEKLRWLAYKQRRSQHAVLLEIIEKALTKVRCRRMCSNDGTTQPTLGLDRSAGGSRGS